MRGSAGIAPASLLATLQQRRMEKHDMQQSQHGRRVCRREPNGISGIKCDLRLSSSGPLGQPSFVMSPLNDIPSPGSFFCPRSTGSRHTMTSGPELRVNLGRGLPQYSQHYTRPCQALVPATGPQESRSAPTNAHLLCHHCGLAERNSVASTHMRWSTTPQLAGKGHLGALHTPTFRHVDRPVLQDRKAGRPL